MGYVRAGDGAVAAQYEYGPFGELVRATGPLAREFNFLFSTKYFDWETGLYYYGYRYYNPTTGRWLNRDPIEEQGGLNLYGFVHNDANSRYDDLGRRDSGTGATLARPDYLRDLVELQRWAEGGVRTIPRIPPIPPLPAPVSEANNPTQQSYDIAAMIAANVLAQQVEKAVENFRRDAKGKDPCEKAKDAVRRAQKGIHNSLKTIAEHEAKIANPTVYLQPGVPPEFGVSVWRKQLAAQKNGLEITEKALAALQKAADVACRCWYKPWTWF